MYRLPYKISSFIKNRFREGYLVEIKPIKYKDSHRIFRVEINENDVIHHLEFNERGKLIKHQTEPEFEEDYYKSDTYGEGESF